MEEPTRKKATLDLLATSYPAKISKVDIIPGISDHDIPTTEIDVTPIRREQAQHKIPIYRKANWDKIREELKKVADKIKEERNNKTANDLWVMFRETIKQAIEQHIPIKLCKTKDNIPYMTADISRLIKRRDRAFKKCCKSQKNFKYSTVNYISLDKK